MRALDAYDDVCGVCGAVVGVDGVLLDYDRNGARCGRCGSAFFLSPVDVDDDAAELVPRGRMLGDELGDGLDLVGDAGGFVPLVLALPAMAAACAFWWLGASMALVQVLAMRVNTWFVRLALWLHAPTARALANWAWRRATRIRTDRPPPAK